MATIHKRLFENASEILAEVQLGATAESKSSNVNLVTNGYTGAHVQVKVEFMAAGTQHVNIFLYSSLDAGVTDDTIAMFSQQVALTVGTTKYVSFIVQDVAHFTVGAAHAANEATEANRAKVTINSRVWRHETIIT